MSRSPAPARILVVDDSPDTLEMIQRKLAGAGHVVATATGVGPATAQLEQQDFDLVVTDLKMPGASGLELVRHVRENLPDTEVMMITGYPSVSSAVTAVKAGAEEYLAKPFTDAELRAAVERALQKLRLRRLAHPDRGEAVLSRFGLVGESPPLVRLLAEIERASATTATVLLTGESGTGKELVARAIHAQGPRGRMPFVPVNCGAIPEDLLESELFGHVRGSFTGARETRPGFFQTAQRGTIFLDEIAETAPSMQVKLLRVIQDKQVVMVGARRTQQIDVRIIAATNRDLPALVSSGRFREDLYYRLDVIGIAVPPLRERGDDVLLLARHFADGHAAELGRRPPRFSDAALAALGAYGWPGNVRELENTIQRLVVMVDRDMIDVSDLPAILRFAAGNAEGDRRTLAEVEREHIRQVLDSVQGNKSRAARILGIDRKTLREKIREPGGPAD
jgi:two-component system response regulator HydG